MSNTATGNPAGGQAPVESRADPRARTTVSPGLWALAWRRLRADHVAMLALGIVALYMLALLLSASGLLARDWEAEVGVNYAPPTFVGAQSAAERGALSTPDEQRAQAGRMLEDPRAAQTVDDFHAQWLDLARYGTINRDSTLFPNFSASVPSMMEQETVRFVRSVILTEKAPFQSLYTANHTFVNAELARIYGLSGNFGTGFQRVTLEPTQRKGLLTQPGLLASHSYSRTDSPIHRGVFVVRRVIGTLQADPPPGIDFTLPPLVGTVRTTRDQVTLKTSARDCAGCHTSINGPGFAFGHYDALGQWRTQENGIDVDTAGEVILGGARQPFTDALGLIDLIAASQEARSNYSRNWFRFASQRAESPGDSCELEQLTSGLAASDRPARELLVDLALLPSFRLRPTESR